MNDSLFQLQYAKRIETIPQTEDIDNFVANALRYVIQHVFSNIANAFVVTISTKSDAAEFWFHDIMSKLFATFGFMTVQLVVRNRNLADVQVPGRRFCNMILVDSFDSLYNSNISEHNRRFDSLEYYFIFLQIPDAWMPMQMEKILKFCFENYWLHCNVMTQNNRGEVLIYTYFPFEGNSCFRTDPVLINKFDGERFVNEVMFPNKMKNLCGCPLKLTTWDVPPFIIYPLNRTVYGFSGLEMIILEILSELINFSIQLDNITSNGKQETNKISSRELLEMQQLSDLNTNITAGFFQRTTSKDMMATPSYMTYNLPLIPVIMRKQKKYESMDMLTFPFDTFTWLILIITTIILIAINFIGTKSEMRWFYGWHILETLLGVPTCRVPKPLALKTCFIMWILSSFILRSVYQSQLFHLYRTHFYATPPPTLAALADDGYTAVCTQRSLPFLKYVPRLMDKSLPLIVLNTSNEMAPLRYIEEHSESNLVAMSVEDFIYYYVANELKPGGALIVLPVIVNNQQISIYFSKHSYLIERFDEFILRFHQAGLLDTWRMTSRASYKITKRTGAAATTIYEDELMINMKQVFGYIKTIIILDCIAIIVFVLELASKRMSFLKKIL